MSDLRRTGRKERIVKVRNIRVARIIGKKTLTGLLVVGMAAISPMTILADSDTSVVIEKSESKQLGSGQEGVTLLSEAEKMDRRMPGSRAPRKLQKVQ